MVHRIAQRRVGQACFFEFGAEQVGSRFGFFGGAAQADKGRVKRGDIFFQDLLRVALGIHGDKDHLNILGFRTHFFARVMQV